MPEEGRPVTPDQNVSSSRDGVVHQDNPKLSFREQIREAKKNADGPVTFLITAFAIVSVTAGCTVLMAILLFLPIFVFFVGLVNLNECPVNSWIPVYLLVLGGLVIFSNISFLARSCCTEKIVTCINCLQLPINFFLIIWFILGNIWVYGSLHKVNTSRQTIVTKDNATVPNDLYCDYLTYWLAFWLITVVYVVVVLTVVGAVVAVCCLKRMKKKEVGEETPIVDNAAR